MTTRNPRKAKGVKPTKQRPATLGEKWACKFWGVTLDALRTKHPEMLKEARLRDAAVRRAARDGYRAGSDWACGDNELTQKLNAKYGTNL